MLLHCSLLAPTLLILIFMRWFHPALLEEGRGNGTDKTAVWYVSLAVLYCSTDTFMWARVAGLHAKTSS